MQGRLHLIVDAEAGREFPVFIESTNGGVLAAYLLPDELWIDDGQVSGDRLGYLSSKQEGTAYTMKFTLRAEVSEYLKTRGRSIVAARFGIDNITENIPPTKYIVAFVQGAGTQSLGPDCPVDEVGVSADLKIADATQNTTLTTKPITFQQLMNTFVYLTAPNEQAALTMELRRREGEKFVETDMQYKLAFSFGRRTKLKPESIVVDVVDGDYGNKTMLKNNSRLTARVLSLVAEGQPFKLVPVPADFVIEGEKQREFPNAGNHRLKVLSVQTHYTSPTNIYDLLAITDYPKWLDYEIKLSGFREAKIPASKGGGTFLDLQDSKVAIWFRNAKEMEFVKWKEWTLTELRAANDAELREDNEKMRYHWRAPSDVVFRVEVECHPYGGGSGKPPRRLKFLLDKSPLLDLSETEQANRALAKQQE